MARKRKDEAGPAFRALLSEAEAGARLIERVAAAPLGLRAEERLEMRRMSEGLTRLAAETRAGFTRGGRRA